MIDLLNSEDYSSNFLKIVDKKFNLLPLKYNPFQREVHHVIQEKKKNRLPIRIIVLKARQVTMSTFGVSYLYHDSATNFFRNSLVIADDLDNTSKLFKMAKRFYDFTPEKIRPLLKYSNAKELLFENSEAKTKAKNPGLMSSLQIQTSNKLTAGRGSTIANLHISEFAFWANASIVVTGLFQSVPREPNTFIFIESTANGIAGKGEEFYNRWKEAEAGESEFVPLFFPWWRVPEYEMDPPQGFTLDEFERDLIHLYPAMNLRKLAWRRYKIKNEMGRTLVPPEDKMKQEFPSCPTEAFLSTGRPVFDMKKILLEIEAVKDLPKKIGRINGLGEFTEDPTGNFILYGARPSSMCALGSDVAEGLETGDYSTICGLSRDLEQTLSYHEHIAPDSLGLDVCRAGAYFGKCLVVVESNNHGYSTLIKVRDSGYPNIFHRETRDEVTDKMTLKLGWQTNLKTKVKMLDDFAFAWRDGILKLRDIELLKEMGTLYLEPDGEVNLNGKDRVVGACLALQGVKQLPLGDEYKAYDPAHVSDKPKTLEEKLKYFKNKRDYESQF